MELIPEGLQFLALTELNISSSLQELGSTCNFYEDFYKCKYGDGKYWR